MDLVDFVLLNVLDLLVLNKKRLEINNKISKQLNGRKTAKSIKKYCLFCKNEFFVTRQRITKKFCSVFCKNKNPISEETRKKISFIKKGNKNPMFGKSPKHTKNILVNTTKTNSHFLLVRSSYEKKFVLSMENNHNVSFFEYEPKDFKVIYNHNGKKTYQPDFLVVEKDKRYIVEIKAEWQRYNENTILKEKAFKSVFPEIEYKILTELKMFL